MDTGRKQTTTPSEGGDQKTYTVTVRGREVPHDLAIPFTGATPRQAFEAALNADIDQPEPIISWNSEDDIAAIDVDYHTDYKPDRTRLEEDVYRFVADYADAFWVTHGNRSRPSGQK
jgi:hypothetical protein